MAALARAGVPLDQGLLHLGRDLPGRLGRIAQTIGQRLERGEEPARVFDDPSLPTAYRALVAAGVRSGRLPLALEGMSALLRRVVETRRMVVAALVYQIVVLAVAYVLFAFNIAKFFPVLAHLYEDVLPGQHPLAAFQWLADNVAIWIFWPPLLLFVLLGAWWFRTQYAVLAEGPSAGHSAGHSAGRWCGEQRPSVRNLLHAGRLATFADVLAVLVEHQVPLPEAIGLAADASGDRCLRESGRQLAERLRRGETPTGVTALAGAPPVLNWLLMNTASQDRWRESLRRAAESYRRRAQWMSRWLSLYLPVTLTVAIGGTAAAAYGVAVFAPWCRLMYLLSQP
ncbi:MAG: type II secretion system F family protein [Planctomycetota bacterium]|nr:type II secretion system F family protein [Planctomycetota bacterium]